MISQRRETFMQQRTPMVASISSFCILPLLNGNCGAPAAELFLRRLASRVAARIAQAGLSQPGQDERYVPASNFMIQPPKSSSVQGERPQLVDEHLRRATGPAWLLALLQGVSLE